MFFWKASIGKRIKNHLKLINSKIEHLETFSEKFEKAVKYMNEIMEDYDKLEEEIKERCEEEKVKPWVNKKYCRDMDILLNLELQQIKKLEGELTLYQGLLHGLAVEDMSESDKINNLHEITNTLSELEDDLRARDHTYEVKMALTEKESLQNNLSMSYDKVSNIKTNDGISYQKIVKVVRSLGATVEKRSTHQFHIVFKLNRVPISMDISLKRLASQIKRMFEPEIVLNTLKLINALKTGDVQKLAA